MDWYLGWIILTLNLTDSQDRHGRSLYSGGKYVFILGDANLCAFKWNDDTYQYKPKAEYIEDFLLETSSFQKVKDYTRS